MVSRGTDCLLTVTHLHFSNLQPEDEESKTGETAQESSYSSLGGGAAAAVTSGDTDPSTNAEAAGGEAATATTSSGGGGGGATAQRQGPSVAVPAPKTFKYGQLLSRMLSLSPCSLSVCLPACLAPCVPLAHRELLSLVTSKLRFVLQLAPARLSACVSETDEIQLDAGWRELMNASPQSLALERFHSLDR